jgi:ribosome recycling factor
LTNDGRKELLKKVKEDCEKFRVSIRRLRQDARKELQGMKKGASVDEMRKNEKDVESLTEKFVKNVDEVYEQKEKEIKSN